ncbi:MAG TPA: TDP-N-acetylfucosamine:lipid II N-acetylfucosaminyltransferase, partial [Gallicola sp.]|nr:TDP-N-acetylfucosamine:lipid II N-acetylfucosaminyltransferase [Gallicola sp.]
MSVLHITTGSNYNVTIDFIKFINGNFTDSSHRFLVIDNPKNVPSEFKNIDNIIIIDRNDNKYYKLIYKYIQKQELVILHSLCLDVYFQMFLLTKPLLMKKIVWVAWGMDLYQWMRNSNKIVYKLRNYISYNFRQKIKYFVGIFPPDIDYFKKEFKSNAITFYASYTGNLYNPLYGKDKYFNKLEDKVKGNGCINIQIGHSSTKTLNHLEVLKSLEKFKGKNIRIYLPLSYGDMKYGDFVEEKAKKLFGDKAICIREMMSREDYMEYLSTIDIAIFNTTRQIGLGNISPMLY